MRICFLGDAASIHIRRWVEYFRDKEHDVSIITLRDYKIDNVDVRFIGDKLSVNEGGGNFQYLKKIREIRRIIKQINPDIVNAHYLTSYGFLSAVIKDRPLVVSTWGTDILVTPKKNIVYKKITKYVLKKSDLVTTDSMFMSDEIFKLGCNRDKVITVPMGIELNEFNLNGREKKNKLFLSMRTLCDNSNIDIILEAFKMLHDEDNDVKLIITNSGDNKEKVLQLIEELKISNAVEYLGFVDRNKVSELLKKASFFISIPKSDSTSVTLLEAMACGSLPILSDIPANKEWVKDGKNGVIMNEFSAKSLFQVMKNILNDDKLFDISMNINDKIIKEGAVWENNMQIVLESYNKIIKKVW